LRLLLLAVSFLLFIQKKNMASDGSVFTWKAEYQKVVAWTGAGPAIASLVASAVVLVLAFLIYLNHATRRSLQRQSLQMLLWVQAASIVYNGSYLCVIAFSLVFVVLITIYSQG
jgi:hypothetical protein